MASPVTIENTGPMPPVPEPAGRRPKRRRSSRLSLNLTAMIDVVFLLLIYFMVATEFKAGEEIYRLDLPERQAQQTTDPFDLDEEPLRIVVASTGTTRQAYRITVEGPYPQPRDFDELGDFLRSRRLGPHTRLGLFEPEHPVVIVPTRLTRWEHAVEAFNTVVHAEYSNITFAPIAGPASS